MTEKLSAEEQAVADRYERVMERVEAAKARYGISYPITVAAATKTVSPELIRFAHRLGLAEAGENRVQELTEKAQQGAYEGMKLHFIGRLQLNKVKYLPAYTDSIQSLDSLALAEEIDKRYGKAGRSCTVLVEVNSGEEAGKGGVAPSDTAEFFERLGEFEHLKPAGLMTVAPICADPGEYRKYFSKTYSMYIDILAKKTHNIDVPVLSMGMSDNFEEAIACGATMIRPGSAIFGKRM